MKILCITHKYPPQTGGMEKQSYELITRLSKHAEVVSITYHGQTNKLLWILGLRRRVKRILQKHGDIDIIHLNDGLMATLCTWLKGYTDIPVTVTLHGLDITYPWAPYRKLVVPRLKQLDKIIAVSTATRQVCLDLGFEEEQVVTVVNGVDHDLVGLPTLADVDEQISSLLGRPLAEHRLVVGLGRAVRRKGFSWFAREVIPLLDDDIIFAIIGPYEQTPSLLTRLLAIAPQSIRHNIELLLGHMSDSAALVTTAAHSEGQIVQLGRVDFDLLMSILARADIFVMPNINVPGDAEGFGLVALEASLRQTAVLAADTEGITSAIHHQGNGLLLPPSDPEPWAAEIRQLLADDQVLLEMGRQGADYTLLHFGWDQMVVGYRDVLRDVVEHTIE